MDTLTPTWSPLLVVLSYCISWLGAYTGTQLIVHAKYTSSPSQALLWAAMAGAAFGFCSIWSMHFLGMLALNLQVPVQFSLPLTVASALVAVGFTSIGIGWPFLVARYRRSGRRSWWQRLLGSQRRRRDAEAQPFLSESEREFATVETEEAAQDASGTERNQEWHAHGKSADPVLGPSVLPMSEGESEAAEDSSEDSGLTDLMEDEEEEDDDERDEEEGRGEEAEAHPLAAEILLEFFSSDAPLEYLTSAPASAPASAATSPGASRTFWEGGRIPVPSNAETPSASARSVVAKKRRKFSSKDLVIPWRRWVIEHWETLSVAVYVRAAMWSAGIVGMHYCGMLAMQVSDGWIEWNIALVLLSSLIAFVVCILGTVAMYQMETHLVRQMVVSAIAAAGVCGMHYTGMAAAKFHSTAAPDPHAGYPRFLPMSIVSVAVAVLVVANAALANSATLARNRMAEAILTRRRLWRIMAEKEAADRANALRLQFISVASHEIRTPLHTVNGYAELLARTPLSTDQQLYVTSIQQACHAINVIAGNVLDFNKLDRANVESDARPVLVDTRQMLEGVARISEVGCQDTVELIVSVAPNMPKEVYLDETYALRVLTNLLSNAQKFTQDGFIYAAFHVDPSGAQDGSTRTLVATIRDTGCGISPEYIDVIFEPFRQADSSLTRPHQGAGLGLSIVKHLVQRMGGTIEVHSEVAGEDRDGGSVFVVKMPVKVPLGDEQPGAGAVPNQSRGKQRLRRLHVVCSHSRTADLFEEIWSEHGFDTRVVHKTDSADDVRGNADIIWTDIAMMRSQAVRDLLVLTSGPSRTKSAPNGSSPPLVCVVHSTADELAALEPALSEAKNVLLVKRPVVANRVIELLRRCEDEDSEGTGCHWNKLKYALADPPKLRFATTTVDMVAGERLPMASTGAGGAIMPPTSDAILDEGRRTNEVIAPDEIKKKVLLVEDNLINQRLGKKLLESLGYDVITANDGQQAVDTVAEETVDCCFMDCQMPVMDGFDATRRIREMEVAGTLKRHLPIVALTANVTSESEEQCRNAGMEFFMPKPLRLADLETVLRNALHPPSGRD
ncbi:hypothetical protein PUNSTDRAFT_135640 [Punctularia strigosozonata HHB-11173 SS5]|uniref:uncharacterized protein n=1 Tax=Punctularia strigosozonata (strain HHB-11173) TaxID=741275 RepID=UPI00044178D4|nr:uncharacterized protein PUNSTDRAFT_135640 [Punctularia strigosozonata HHB-11173 SS5]EIN06939.1 hypothetical protein PUNSTDRAFT_135640 [Punctularia strigosozonata HHB-11173 SS5]